MIQVNKPLIYVAGPYSAGNISANVREAVLVAEAIVANDAVPYVPHLDHLWDLIIPHSYMFWIELGLEYVRRSDAVYRMPGHSPGADKEVELAQELGIPILTTIGELLDFINEWNE